MLTHLGIIDQIKLSNYPYYRLRGHTDAFTNKGMNIGDNLSDESATVEGVLKNLERHIKTYSKGNPSFIFEIDLLKKPSSNQGGIHGPFSFTVEEAPEVKQKQDLPTQQFSGLGEIQEHMKAVSQMQNDLFQPRLDLQSQKNELMYDRKELERERKAFDKEKAEKELELKELKIKFERKSDIAKDGFEKAALSIIEKFTGKDDKGLGGTAQIEEEANASPEEKMIESIAINILEHQEKGDIDLADIQVIGIAVQKKITELK